MKVNMDMLMMMMTMMILTLHHIEMQNVRKPLTHNERHFEAKEEEEKKT